MLGSEARSGHPFSALGVRVSDLSERALDLSRVNYGDTDLEAVLRVVIGQAKDRIPHCDEASITLMSKGNFATPVETDEIARRADELQYKLDEGPCVDTAKTGEPHVLEAVSGDTKWPRYASQVRSIGIGSSLGLPLLASDRPIGALNVYSSSERVFDQDDKRFALDLADQAGVVIANAVAFQEQGLLRDQLQQAVETREMIGKAIGILMERESISDEEAFSMLRVASQNSNIKLRDIAAEVVDRALQAARSDRHP